MNLKEKSGKYKDLILKCKIGNGSKLLLTPKKKLIDNNKIEILHWGRCGGKVNNLAQEAKRQRILFEHQKVTIISDLKPTFDSYYANSLLHLPQLPATNTPHN